MLRLTWEWIGFAEPALDLANTIALENGVERDFLERLDEYPRWGAAAAKSPSLGPDEAAAIARSRRRLLELRAPVRRLFATVAAGEPRPAGAVAELNRVSRASPRWPELVESGLRERAAGSSTERLCAAYARSAIEIAAGGRDRLRVCGAPSCGMFYRPGREGQRWCSTQCGTRARVARHYGRRR